MARVQGMTPEGIRKLIAASVAFIKDLNVEDLNKLLAAFEDANGIFDVRLVEAQEAVKAAGDKALEAEEQARIIVDELAKYEQAQAEEAARILGEVAVAIDAANLASAKVPGLLARLELAERSVSTANAEVEKFITKQDEFLAISQEQVTKVNDLNSGFQELNQAVDESITKVDEANENLGLVSADLDAAKASLDAKMKQNELDISAAQEAADSNQNAISDLNRDLSGLSTKHDKLTSNFSAEVEKLEKADASLLTSMNTKVGELNATTAAQSTAISAAKTQADKGVSDAAAASFALATYKTVNDPKVAQAQKDADKGIEDASAALAKANTAAGKLPAMNTAISSAAAAAKKANDALPAIRTDISGLTTSISTATGKLTSLQSDVDSKVSDLQAMDQSQAQGITKAQADATKAIGDAKAAADKLPGMVKATSNAAAAAKKANDALPAIRTDISGLTTSISTATGNLSSLQSEVDTKVAALQAVDKTQALEITKAQSAADQAALDATNKSNAARVAAELAAKGMADQAQADAEVEAARAALVIAQKEAKAAKDAAAVDATDKANAAQTAAETLAKAEAKAAKEAAEANAAIDATTKANKAKTDAESKAATLATAAKDAAAKALNTYKGVNDPKVTKAQTDATKAIGDAKAAADKLPGMVTATSNAAAAAKKANDALPALSSGISTLTSKLATTTGNLSSLQSDVDTKVAALQAVDKTQAGEISTAKSQAAKGISDAASALGEAKAATGALPAINSSLSDASSKANQAVAALPGLTTGVTNAQKSADDTLAYAQAISQRGDNLIPNGFGELKSNKYFESFTYIPDDSPIGTYGSFENTTTSGAAFGERISVDPMKPLTASLWVRKLTENQRVYFAIEPYDADDKMISPQYWSELPGTRSQLAKPLRRGDTAMHLVDANMEAWAGSNVRGLIVWNYVDSSGKTWPPGTYSRNFQSNMYEASGVNGNVITFNKPWDGLDAEAGTWVGCGRHGGTYLYPCNVMVTNDDWQYFEGIVGGSITQGLTVGNGMPAATVAVRPRILLTPQAANVRVAGLSLTYTKTIFNSLEKAKAEVSALNTKAAELTTGLSNAATQEQYNTLNTRLWGNQGEINTINTTFQTQQKQINDNNTAFQTWQTDINSKRDKWEDGATLALQHLTDFTTRQTKWNKASTDATKALSDAAAAQKSFNDNQTKWNLASSNATKALADLTTEQGKVLALQKELNTKRDRWENGATLAIDNLTNFATRQDKWNKASTDATKALSDAAKAQKSFNDNQTKWNLASTNATKALADLTTEQGKVLALQKELNTKRDRWENGATLAIDNLTNFSTRQDKWNKASSNATKALSDAGKAQLDATKAITQILNMVYPNNSLVPLAPDTNLPVWTKHYSKNTGGNWLVTGAAKSFSSSTSPHVAVQTGQIYRAIVRIRASTGTPSFSIRLRPRGSETSISPVYVAIPTKEVPTGMVVKNWLGSTNFATSTTWQEWVCDFRLPDTVEDVRIGYVYSTTSAVAEVSRLEIFPLLPSQKQIDDIQNKTIESHTALFAGQNKWNEVASAAIQSQATLIAKQDRWSDGVNKALAWQDQLNNAQSDINKTTKSVLANQGKWNSAQAEINNAQSNTNKAVKSVLDNQDKWNSAQAEVNNAQSVTNKAVKLVNDNQKKWNTAVTQALKAHDELFVSTTKTFKAVKAVTDNQGKWNKVVSDLVTTNSAVSSANKTAIEGLNRVLGLKQNISNAVPEVPGGVRTSGTDIAPVFTPMPAWLETGSRATITDIPGIASILGGSEKTVVNRTAKTAYKTVVDPNTEYKFSMWVKAAVAGKVLRVLVGAQTGTDVFASRKYTAGATGLSGSSSQAYLIWHTKVPTTWTKIEGTFTLKPHVREFYIRQVQYNYGAGTAPTTIQLADIQIYPNMPSQAEVNKALLDSDKAQNLFDTNQKKWNDAASRSIATVENLWGKTAEDVGEINIITEELGEKIKQQSDDFAKNITQLFTFIPRIAYAMDGQDVPASETDGFVKITRTKSGNRTTKVAVEAVGRWVGTMIIEGDHGLSDGKDKTFKNMTPIRLKQAVNSATRAFYLNRSTSMDHIGAVKVTFLVDPGQVVVLYPKGTNFIPDKSAWTTLHTQEITSAESTEHNLSLSATFSGTTYEDTYGVRIRVGNTVVAELKKSKIGPLFPGQNGTRVMSVQKAQVHIPAGTNIYFEAYSTGRDYPLRRVSKWNSQISYITSGRA